MENGPKDSSEGPGLNETKFMAPIGEGKFNEGSCFTHVEGSPSKVKEDPGPKEVGPGPVVEPMLEGPGPIDGIGTIEDGPGPKEVS